MKNLLRNIILALLYGVYVLARPFLRRPEVSVLMYHSVSESGWFYAVSPRQFERQMRYLREKRNPVSLADAADYASGKRRLPSRSVAVTFDDGYRDFLTEALPVLKKYGIPSAVFVCAGEAERRELGNDFPLMDEEEMKRLTAESLVDIGSHGLTHKKLIRLPPAEAKNEIERSRVLLERKIGTPPSFFSYPKGSFNDLTAELAAEADYAGAVTAERGLVRTPEEGGRGPYFIPRMQVSGSVSFFEFRASLTRVSDWYFKLWKTAKKAI